MSFMVFGVLLRVSLLAPLVAGPALRSTATVLRLRWRFRWLRLRLSALPLKFPAVRFTAVRFTTLRFATSGALLFVSASSAHLFVSCAPLFRAFGPLLGMAPAPLPPSFGVGTGNRDVRHGKRTPDGDRAALSASVS